MSIHMSKDSAKFVLALQGIADEMEGKVSVVKIDTDKYPSIASRYGIKVCHKSTSFHLTYCVCCYPARLCAMWFWTGGTQIRG